VPFVVVEVGFDYNDEVYFQPECGGGKPIHIYSSKKKAEQEAQRLTIRRLRTTNPIEFGHGWDEISSLGESDLKEKLQGVFPEHVVSMGEHMEFTIKCELTEHHRLYRAIGRKCPCEQGKDRYHRAPWPSNITDEQLLKVAELLDQISFYTVEEIDID